MGKQNITLVTNYQREPAIHKDRAAMQAKIDADVKAFLERGGKVETLAPSLECSTDHRVGFVSNLIDIIFK